MAAGMSFYAGYPITPSTEIAELALLLPKSGGTFIQMEDEIGSLICVLVAAAAGRRGYDRHERSRLFPDAGEASAMP